MSSLSSCVMVVIFSFFLFGRLIHQGIPSHLLSKGDYRSRFSPKASLLHSWVGTPQNFSSPRKVQQVEVLYIEQSAGGRSNYYRSEDLTTNYLTPLFLFSAWFACGRTFSSTIGILECRAAKASCGCPIGRSLILTFIWNSVLSGAPRRVLMRCMASLEVELLKCALSFIFVYLKSFPFPLKSLS